MVRAFAVALTKERPWWLDEGANARDEMMLAGIVVELLNNLVVDTIAIR